LAVSLDVILMLLTLLTHEIDAGRHRDAWVQYIRYRLLGPVSGVPDTIADLADDR
jgi:hypothetical protein